MFPQEFSSYWQETEEELADLPFLARDLLDEVEIHLSGGDISMVQNLLKNLVNLSHAFDDPIMQAKIRLDVARVGYRIGCPDITRTNACFATGILEGTNPRFPRRDVMCGHVQNHYLAKCYYLLAILESQENTDPDLALFYLHRCQDKVSNLRCNPFDHLWTGNGHYSIWDVILQRESDEYSRRRRLGCGGSGGGGPHAPYPGGAAEPVPSIYPPGWPPELVLFAGTEPAPKTDTPTMVTPAEAEPTPEPKDASLIQPSGDVDLPPVIILKGNNIGPLPIMGKLSIGEYIFSAPDPLIPEGSAGFLRPQPGQGSVPVSGPETSEFKIEGARYHLHDLRREGGVLEIDPIKDQYFIVCVKDVTERFAGGIHPGDYLLVHPREIVGINDLIFYERYIPYEYWYKLDQYIEAEFNPPPYRTHDTGEFQDETDHAETKQWTLPKGIVIGVFKPIR